MNSIGHFDVIDIYTPEGERYPTGVRHYFALSGKVPEATLIDPDFLTVEMRAYVDGTVLCPPQNIGSYPSIKFDISFLKSDHRQGKCFQFQVRCRGIDPMKVSPWVEKTLYIRS